jgi:hypothetical protein
MRSKDDFLKIARSTKNKGSYLRTCDPIQSNEVTNAFNAWDEYKLEMGKIDSGKDESKINAGVKGVLGVQSFNYSVASPSLVSGEDNILANAISGLTDILTDKDNKKLSGINQLKKIGEAVLVSAAEGMTQHLKDEVTLRNDINSQIGISGQLSQDFREEIIKSLPVVTSMGYEFSDLSKTVIKTMEQTGRFSLVNRGTMEKMAITSRAFIGDMESSAKLVRDFELLGIGNEEAFDNINKIGQSSLNIGLQARKVVSETQTNLSKINEYGFRNGVEGLSRMVQKSIEFRMGMAETFKIADKVFSPEGAIELSANLQAIGGAIGDLNDPLKLMYMATNNVEGLQDALIGVAGSLATYNTEQGRFEITGINLRRAKGLTDELGISYNELANGAIAAAERSSAAVDLLSSGLKLEDKEKEFLTNISRMEGGKMVIDIPESLGQKLGIKETRVALENLDQSTASAILENQKFFETLSPEEIARQQYTETQKIALTAVEIVTILKVNAAALLRGPSQLVDQGLKYVNDEKLRPFTKNASLTIEEFTDLIGFKVKESFGIKSKSSIENKTSDNKLAVSLEIKSTDITSDSVFRLIDKNPNFKEKLSPLAKAIGGSYSND